MERSTASCVPRAWSRSATSSAATSPRWRWRAHRGRCSSSMTSSSRSGMLQCTRRRSAGEREANVITEAAVRAHTITVWLTESGDDIRARSDYLTQLDAAIGDGDHGTNMTRGFDALGKALAGPANEAL